MASRIFVDTFDTTAELTGRKRTYRNIKAAVLRAGRFSIFEATASEKDARLFDRLNRDPDLIVDSKSVPYPWIIVRKARKDPPRKRR